ncbi:MAG TPA: hypothetical protein VK009_07105 [Chloroflexota bacterium]|nr:hypothetical protein [Chloroflexota bacterium]
MNPERLAYLETAIWKAYYDRRWLAVLWLTLQLVHEQFHLSWLQAIRASYCTTRAAVAWAPVDHDVAKVRRYLARFYELAGVRDPRRVAELELRYWIVHRDLSGQPESEKGPLEDSLAELHAALFGLPVEQTRTSGIARARAADTVDEITSGRSQDVPADWAKVETYLREAYGSLT